MLAFYHFCYYLKNGLWVQFWKEESDKNDDEARERIMEVFPTLKRWKTA